MSPDPLTNIAALGIEPAHSALEAALLLGSSYSWLGYSGEFSPDNLRHSSGK
jgi:hypothetical protein